MDVKIITKDGGHMETQSPSNPEEQCYSINIDKLPAKIKVKIKHIHPKSTFDGNGDVIRRGKSFRKKGTFFQTKMLFAALLFVLS